MGWVLVGVLWWVLGVETDLKNGRRREGASHVVATEAESQKHKVLEGAPVQRKAYLNKYALGGAILASTNSILLGYGKIDLYFIYKIISSFPYLP